MAPTAQTIADPSRTRRPDETGRPRGDRAVTDTAPVVLVGNPNVGKSVLFGALTGRYVTVSNYPGTTVEIARGTVGVNGHKQPIIDTPGIASLVPLSADEQVGREILLKQPPAAVVAVIDTKNLHRGLVLALELAEAGLPIVLNLNMADEAAARGIEVDIASLSRLIGVPVVSTVATRATGIEQLSASLAKARRASFFTTYEEPIEQAVARIAPLLPKTPLSTRSLALMILAGDDGLLAHLALDGQDRTNIRLFRDEAERRLRGNLTCAISRERLHAAATIAEQVVSRRPVRESTLAAVGQWMAHPIMGWPVLAAVLYLMYQFVGVLGAGTFVDLLETKLFGELLNPGAAALVEILIPVPVVQDFLVGEYGLITMGLTYGLAIVLPIVGTFFLAFSFLEDSGYLPRLAVMLDRVFRMMGLNGKAVLPMILGLGCDTMATMTTRILDHRKERIQVTLLLALGVPCSAQLGVLLGMIAGLGAAAIAIWAGVVIGSLLVVGYLSAKLIPGESSDFILEMPPMRLPSLKNIVVKTVARMEWYLKEVLPVFVLGTAALFILDKVGLLEAIERVLAPAIVGWLGLPAEVTGAFLVGFLRRDYGAAGLFVLARDGVLQPVQILVSLVVITLFMPCIAHLLIIIKEHGFRTALAVVAFVFPFAFVVGGFLNLLLRHFNILG